MAVTQLQLVDDVSRRAEALAKVQEMHDQLTEAHAANAAKDATINRLNDRISLVLESDDRHRHEAVRFRKLAQELAVKLIDALLILERAKDALQEIDEIDAITPAEVPTSAAIDALEAEYKSGSKD